MTVFFYGFTFMNLYLSTRYTQIFKKGVFTITPISNIFTDQYTDQNSPVSVSGMLPVVSRLKILMKMN